MAENKMKLTNKLKLFGAAAVIGLAGVSGLNSYFVPDTVKTVIVDTDTKRYGGDDVYLVNTRAGTFKNVDAGYRFKWDSTDFQTDAKDWKGQEVEIEKYGWRIPFMSMYENIVDIKKL